MFKKETIFAVVNGLKHLVKRLQEQGDYNCSVIKFEEPAFDIANITYPSIVNLSSHLILLLDKKLIFVLHFTSHMTYLAITIQRDHNWL